MVRRQSTRDMESSDTKETNPVAGLPVPGKRTKIGDTQDQPRSIPQPKNSSKRQVLFRNFWDGMWGAIRGMLSRSRKGGVRTDLKVRGRKATGNDERREGTR